MKNFQNKKHLQIVLLVAIAVLALGIGYASITAINLFINGNATASIDDSNFNVHFTGTPTLGGNVTPTGSASISGQDNKVAHFDVGGMTKVGDYVTATYTVINESNGIGADITLKVTNTNSEYFKITETISDSQLQAGDTTTGTIKVEMIKTPIQDNVTTSVTGTLTATPIENENATGSSPRSKIAGEPESFATDSWATIKTAVHNNNTSAYHVGDTKTVTIGANNYTVRIANKSTAQNCGNSDYSQTACGFVVEFVDIITTMKMRDTSTNAGGYPATLVFDYLNNTLLGQLPNDLQSVIEPTRVISGYGCTNYSPATCSNPDNSGNNFTSTSQKLYLLSGVEVHGTDEKDPAASTTSQLDYYIGMTGETGDCDSYPGCTITYYNRAKKQYNFSKQRWWLRPANSRDNYGFQTITGNGDLGASDASGTVGVSPAFRIG